MKVARRKKKRKISKARRASRKAARRSAPKARRGAVRKRKRATPRKAALKAKPKAKAAGLSAVAGDVVHGRMGPHYLAILTPGSLTFLAELQRRFDGKRRPPLAARPQPDGRVDACGPP